MPVRASGQPGLQEGTLRGADHPERAGARESEWVAGLAGREGVGTACPVVGTAAAHSVCPRPWLREADVGVPSPATCDPSQALRGPQERPGLGVAGDLLR